jgi:hypothetical protein
MLQRLTAMVLIVWLSLAAASAQPGWRQSRKIDRYARNTPEAFTASPEELSRYLTAPYSQDHEKARSLFAWIAHHIAYDPNPPIAEVVRAVGQTPQQVLENRKAVCEGYSRLFRELCKHAGLRAEVITGYARQTGLSEMGGHAWNAVYLDGEWKLLDVTWAAGYRTTEGNFERNYRDNYFLTAPEQFVREHWPYDPVWQLLYRPLSLDQFQAQLLPTPSKGPALFHFPDTLASIASLTPEAAKEASLRRIIRFDPANQVARIDLTALLVNRASHHATLATEQLRTYLFLTSLSRISHRTLRSETSVIVLLDQAEEHYNQMLFLYRRIRTDLPQYLEIMRQNEAMAHQNLSYIQTEREFLQKNFQVGQLRERE